MTIDKDHFVIVCHISNSGYYGNITTTPKKNWYNRTGSQWVYWRAATDFEIELYYNGIDTVSAMFKL